MQMIFLTGKVTERPVMKTIDGTDYWQFKISCENEINYLNENAPSKTVYNCIVFDETREAIKPGDEIAMSGMFTARINIDGNNKTHIFFIVIELSDSFLLRNIEKNVNGEMLYDKIINSICNR